MTNLDVYICDCGRMVLRAKGSPPPTCNRCGNFVRQENPDE